MKLILCSEVHLSDAGVSMTGSQARKQKGQATALPAPLVLVVVAFRVVVVVSGRGFGLDPGLLASLLETYSEKMPKCCSTPKEPPDL